MIFKKKKELYRLYKFSSLKHFRSSLCYSRAKWLMQRLCSRDKCAIEFPADVDPAGEKLQVMWEILIHMTFTAKQARRLLNHDSCSLSSLRILHCSFVYCSISTGLSLVLCFLHWRICTICFWTTASPASEITKELKQWLTLGLCNVLLLGSLIEESSPRT